MYRLSATLIIIALILLVASFVPWSLEEWLSFAPAGEGAAAQSVEEQGSGGELTINNCQLPMVNCERPVALESTLEPAVEATSTVTDSAERGRTLFMLKGCTTCHQYDGITDDRTGGSVGPNLTHYTNPDPDFVRRWLRDPAAVRTNTQMPDLDLKEEEIDALVAFLLGGQ